MPLRFLRGVDPEGVGLGGGSLVVNGRVLLPFRAKADGKFVGGYRPMAWVGGGQRYLVFRYSGYTAAEQAIFANITGMDRGRRNTYLLDCETLKVYRFADGYEFLWEP